MEATRDSSKRAIKGVRTAQCSTARAAVRKSPSSKDQARNNCKGRGEALHGVRQPWRIEEPEDDEDRKRRSRRATHSAAARPQMRFTRDFFPRVSFPDQHRVRRPIEGSFWFFLR